MFTLILSIPLILFGIWVTLFNNYVLYKHLTTKNDTYIPSIAPFFGGIIFSIGLYVYPYYSFSYYAFIPLFLDYGCIPYTLFVLKYFIVDLPKE